MLNRIEWDKPKVQGDVFSLASLIAWLETKPADKTYNFYRAESCLLGQWTKYIDPFAKSLHHEGHRSSEYRIFGETVDLARFYYVANSSKNDFTFGAALARARKAAQAS